jgi:hypothetical protein
VRYTLAEYLALKRKRRAVPRKMTGRAAKNAYRAARRKGKPIGWSEARKRAHVWNDLCGRT